MPSIVPDAINEQDALRELFKNYKRNILFLIFISHHGTSCDISTVNPSWSFAIFPKHTSTQPKNLGRYDDSFEKQIRKTKKENHTTCQQEKAYQAKLRAMVLNPQKKKTIRPANKKKAYQAKLRAMVLKPPRKKAPSAKPPRRKAQYMSLQELVRSFPGANQKMRVYPNQSTLCSTACRAEGAKKKLHTFLKM